MVEVIKQRTVKVRDPRRGVAYKELRFLTKDESCKGKLLTNSANINGFQINEEKLTFVRQETFRNGTRNFHIAFIREGETLLGLGREFHKAHETFKEVLYKDVICWVPKSFIKLMNK